jgi:hypothetical protein
MYRIYYHVLLYKPDKPLNAGNNRRANPINAKYIEMMWEMGCSLPSDCIGY